MAQLREGRVASHTLAAELLLMHALGRERAWLYAHPEEPVDPVATARYFDLVVKRIAGVPTQYLTGRQEFWGLEFEVTPDVLIPRPETEHVVEVALERLGQDGPLSGAGMSIVDVGTGSGCLAIALATELPEAFVAATDISPAALKVGRNNAARYNLLRRIAFVQCNLLDAFLREPRVTSHELPITSPESRLFHLIVSNPPYVGRGEAGLLPREVREHEPQEALFAGEQGFEVYAPLVRQAEKLLVPRGVLVLELGYNALDRVRPLFDAPAWANVGVTNDLAGIPRVIAAERV